MNIVSKLIENAIKNGTIKRNKLVFEDYENNDEFVIIHKGIHIPIDNISILSYEKYISFFTLLLFDYTSSLQNRDENLSSLHHTLYSPPLYTQIFLPPYPLHSHHLISPLTH